MIVAPVIEKGARSRSVVLPEGEWKADDGKIYKGAQTIVVEAPLNRLPYFILTSWPCGRDANNKPWRRHSHCLRIDAHAMVGL